MGVAEGDPYADYIKQAQVVIDFEEARGIAEWKHEIIEGLRPALDAVRDGRSDWPSLVAAGVTLEHDLFDWRAGEPLKNWFKSGSDEALRALRTLWAEEDVSPGDRIRAFFGLVPADLAVKRKGTGLRPVSVLLMALGPDYPPYKFRQFDRAYRRTGHPRPPRDADEGAAYEHAVSFLDRLVDCCAETPRDRLEAESILWQMEQAAQYDDPSPQETVALSAAWVIRAGRDGEREGYNLQNGLAAMGWGNVADLRDVSSRHDISAMVRQALPDARDGAVRNYARQLWSLRSGVEVGDLVVLPLKTSREIALGTVTQEYSYRTEEDSGWRHVVSVDWQRTDVPRNAVEHDLLRSLGAPLTIYSIKDSDDVRRLHELLLTGRDPGSRSPHHDPQGDGFGSGLEGLADEVLWDVAHLERIERLLRDKRQVIFQGASRYGQDPCRPEARAVLGWVITAGAARAVPSVVCLRGLRAGLSSDPRRRPSRFRASRRSFARDGADGRGRTGRDPCARNRRDQPGQPRQGLWGAVLPVGVPRRQDAPPVLRRGVLVARQPVDSRHDEYR